jgi:4-amino-4-deoxy-L-arabinose transferase-like glycosyltransferase
MKRWLSNVRPAWWCALAFVALGCGLLPYPGVQTDEALAGAAYFQQTASVDKFRAFGHEVPTMAMSYLGSLKTWVLALVFFWFPPTVWAVRLPMLVVGGAAVFVFARFMERLHGRTAAWVAAALLATDASLVVTTTFDWGPVALQHLLQVSAAFLLWRFHREGRAWMLALAAFLLGLALWNKALFGWTLLGAGGAALLLFPLEIWRRVTWRNLAWALVFFAGGASMLIRYNVRHPGETLNSNAKLSLAHIKDKHIHVMSLLDGSGAFGYVIAEDNYGDVRFTYGKWLFAGAALVALLARQRALAYPLLAALLTWLVMASTADAGGAVHHTVLLYPFFHWMLAGVVALVPWRIPVAVLVSFLVVDGVRVTGAYRDNAQRLGGGVSWSDAIFPFMDRVKARNPAEVRLYDWGLQDNLILLSGRAWAISYPARPFGEAAFTEVPKALWLGHVNERIAGINTELFAAAERFGYERVVVERVADRRGRPVLEAFVFRKR